MGKAVQVKWNHEGSICVEYCILVSDDDVIAATDGTALWIDGDEPRAITIADISGGKVMFEDDGGVFGLDPNVIISIDEV